MAYETTGLVLAVYTCQNLVSLINFTAASNGRRVTCLTVIRVEKAVGARRHCRTCRSVVSGAHHRNALLAVTHRIARLKRVVPNNPPNVCNV